MKPDRAYWEQLGHRMRSWREGRGLRQQDVAISAGLRQATISLYEAGKRDIPFAVVDSYAQDLGVPLELLARMTFEEAAAAGKARKLPSSEGSSRASRQPATRRKSGAASA